MEILKILNLMFRPDNIFNKEKELTMRLKTDQIVKNDFLTLEPFFHTPDLGWRIRFRNMSSVFLALANDEQNPITQLRPDANSE